MTSSHTPVRRALLSVFYKDGIVELGKALAAQGAELLSTGGTMRALQDAGLEVTEVAEYTGFPEMMDGRVKTLHPMIHGGLLARRDDPSHIQAMTDHGIGAIDMVVVNLYPFEETVAGGGSFDEIIEKIDIGGPSMLRSAAKNYASVAVVCDTDDYTQVVSELESGGTSLELRQRLAAKVFARTGEYDSAIGRWFADQAGASLRYGENPHQQAGFYPDAQAVGLGAAKVIDGGKELSYNNWLDLDGAVAAVNDLPSPSAVVVKHTNPCGAALSKDSASAALEKAWEGDPLSAFGSVVAVNGHFDLSCAEFLGGPNKFVEVLAAPSFDPSAIEFLRNGPKWGKNLRIVEIPDIGSQRNQLESRRVWGGSLVQGSDDISAFDADLKVAGKVQLQPKLENDARLAQVLVKHLKSNAICLVKDMMLVGAGAGQMSRVDSAEIAVKKAGDRAQGSVVGSDAFFPFPDGPLALSDAGVAAIIQPGGSMRDDEVTAACDEKNVCMVHTGTRHFKH
ncbi:MAG: bifunctional phosphoribosylaminoimidazolecarboxamide formyltransferase/IMP cyclohydrolase [Planctomycetota bacterium]|jgi:phosphoribosylaminoimidazolecarboxamide formyltransferase/IMP cyclohydrolase|nr:bifunctional phosphoribosylaminoimidazolecarboxamide formyltransferase/IMP cyclohydrolase [Planctomycetota bacterium]